MTSLRFLLLLSIALAPGLAGCPSEPPPPPEPLTLIDHDLWVELGAEEDPFDDRPAEPQCSPLAYGYEYIGEGSFEVDLFSCDYLSVAQPSLHPVEAGDELRIRLWHNQLSGPVGQGHIAVSLGGELAWEQWFDIPGGAELLAPVWTATEDVAAGSDLVFHIHNHGSNTYNLIEFSGTDL